MSEQVHRDDPERPAEEEGPAAYEPGCAFQDATDLATRFLRLGLETASLPFTFLPQGMQDKARHGAAGVLRGAAEVPRVVSGVLDEVAREVEVPLEESNLAARRRAEAGEEEPPEPEPRESGSPGG